MGEAEHLLGVVWYEEGETVNQESDESLGGGESPRPVTINGSLDQQVRHVAAWV